MNNYKSGNKVGEASALVPAPLGGSGLIGLPPRTPATALRTPGTDLESIVRENALQLGQATVAIKHQSDTFENMKIMFQAHQENQNGMLQAIANMREDMATKEDVKRMIGDELAARQAQDITRVVQERVQATLAAMPGGGGGGAAAGAGAAAAAQPADDQVVKKETAPVVVLEGEEEPRLFTNTPIRDARYKENLLKVAAAYKNLADNRVIARATTEVQPAHRHLPHFHTIKVLGGVQKRKAHFVMAGKVRREVRKWLDRGELTAAELAEHGLGTDGRALGRAQGAGVGGVMQPARRRRARAGRA